MVLMVWMVWMVWMVGWGLRAGYFRFAEGSDVST